MTGCTQDSQATIVFCEFSHNGNTNAPSSAPTHNIYIYGGYLTMRYCFVHDSVQGQNFHIRSRMATLEYNWFARAANYEGDLMSDDDFGEGYDSPPYSQTMILRGNVIVQNPSPGNHSQVIAIYNDEEIAGLTLSVQALYNTFVGTYGSSQFVHVSNADGTRMNAQISDNVISGTTVPYYIEDTATGSASGANNWLPANAMVGVLSNSVQDAAPGFINTNTAIEDYHLGPGSDCIGAADTVVHGLPGREYYYNEATNLMWRPRAAVYDIGAFESTSTNSPVGPYDLTPQPLLNVAAGAGNAIVSWPLFAQDFQLEQSSVLYPPVWNPAAFSLTTNAANIAVIIPTSTAQGFFRLQQ